MTVKNVPWRSKPNKQNKPDLIIVGLINPLLVIGGFRHRLRLDVIRRVIHAINCFKENTMHVYQICPKCNGQGTVSKPPWVDGDVHQWVDSTNTGGYTCNVCNGAKIIPMPNELIAPDEQYILVKKSEYTIYQGH